MDEKNLVSVLKVNNILLHEGLDKKDFLNKIRSNINNRNVALFYKISNYFNFNQLSQLTSCHIERCFTSVCETNNFLELDFILIIKILASSELCIDSELEVLYAAEDWVRYNFAERSKHAKDLLLKVRLPLLSPHVLNNLLTRNFYFNDVDDCVDILKEVAQNTKKYYQEKPNIYFSNRFCTQNMFDIVMSGGENTIGFAKNKFVKFQQIRGENFDAVKSLASIKTKRIYHKSIYCKGNIFVFGGYNVNGLIVVPVDKYSFITDTWEHVADMTDNRTRFCACAFMHNIFIIGGMPYYNINSCLTFGTKDNKWKKVQRMNEARIDAACTVFEGRVVVSGGYNGEQDSLNTVEVYDHIADTWTCLPSMNETRYRHSSVAIKNKLLVIGSISGTGRKTCEVFDSTSKQFVFLKQKSNSFAYRFKHFFQTFSIGKQLIVLGNRSKTAVCYDVEKDEWSEVAFKVTGDISYFSCVIVPKMQL